MNTAPNKDDLRKFGLVTGGMVMALFGVIFPFFSSRPYTLWPWVVGGILLAWALILPASLAPVHKYWMRLSLVLGWINTRIILTIIFYILITPVGFLLRLSSRDPMARKFDEDATSYRIPSHTAGRENIKRPF
jgi:hypothetical protein